MLSFFAISLILMGAFLYFLLSTNIERKKKYFKPFLIRASLLFFGFIWIMDLPSSALTFATPAAVLIAYINAKMTRFCERCGKTVIPLFSFSPPRHCSHCGEKL